MVKTPRFRKDILTPYIGYLKKTSVIHKQELAINTDIFGSHLRPSFYFGVIFYYLICRSSILFCFLGLHMEHIEAYGGSQDRGLIRASAAGP